MARFPSLDAAAEADLLAKARGDTASRRESFRILFETLREPVLALCLHLTGRRADAEDATQDVFIAAQGALGRFRGEANLSTWIYRIAIRTALRAKSHRRADAQLDLDLPGSGGEAEMATRDEARRVLEAMQRLPLEHRAVLSLFALEGLKHRDIADVLGVPEGTIWSRLHAARKLLAQAMEQRISVELV